LSRIDTKDAVDLGVIVGNVKWFDPERGFGFIHDDDGRDFFVHWSAIVRPPGEKGNLTPDQRVTFRGWKGAKGFFVSDVRPTV
jgi:CspA family cold shock protein